MKDFRHWCGLNSAAVDAVRGQAIEVAHGWSKPGSPEISLNPLVPLGTSGRESVQGIDVPAQLVAEYQRHGVFALLGLVTVESGRWSGRLFARAHPSGTGLTWLEETGDVGTT